MSTAATSPEPSSRISRRAACCPGAGRCAMVVSLLLLLNFLYFLCSTGRVRTMDEVSAAFQVESLARHGTTAIPQAVKAQLFYGTIDRFGHPESPYPPRQLPCCRGMPPDNLPRSIFPGLRKARGMS
jgi:hypothetical protein